MWVYIFTREVFFSSYNEMKLAEMEQEKENPIYHSRTSRIQKWMELVKRAQQDLEMPLDPPKRLMSLDLFQPVVFWNSVLHFVSNMFGCYIL